MKMRDAFNLMRDLLDNQMVDPEQRPVGRVDGVTALIRDGEPPRILSLESGFPVLMRRLHPRLGEWAFKLAARISQGVPVPCRISMDTVRDIGLDVEVDVRFETTDLLHWERRLREKIVRRIPGGN
jgi:hypothetical protein